MVQQLLDSLNPTQREIVKDTEGYILTLAGAGSGKTRVLTSRGAYLLANGVRPWSILMMTFTNKAAREMKERLVTLAGTDARDVWVGTFHSTCVRILGRYGKEIGLERFTIVDDKEQKKLITIAKEAAGITSEYEINTIASAISNAKNALQTPEDLLEVATRYHEKDMAQIYRAYEDSKDEQKYIDFDDLIMKTVHLLNHSAEVRQQYQNQFNYVMVDEFQDTNRAQSALLDLFSQQHENLFVVGDADQCQPPETIVETPGGPKQIADLKDGDQVLAWNRKSQYVTSTGYPIKIAERSYSGNMFSISADRKTTRATPNHKFLVRWTERTQNIWVTYLMYRQDRGYRVGWCQLFNVDGNFHLGIRARLEKADKVWILATHESKKQATVYESIMSMRYGIPLAMFEPNNELYDEEVVAQIFAGANPYGGELCLRHHKKEVEYPFYPYPNQRDSTGRPTYFECYASNLIEGLMSIPLPGNKQNLNQWAPIISLECKDYEGPVYSLDVETHHNYVADGLVTLNSIYRWRGAELANILRFTQTYPTARLHRLEQNYRSTATIVQAANALIENNKERLEKTSFTEANQGDPIVLYQAEDDGREADFIAAVIHRTIQVDEGAKYSDFAVLYRTNRQSRAIEAALMQARIPYQVLNGTNFYDRKEIKDVTAYLRIVDNEFDALALNRIINIPKRGIGDTTVDKIADYAEECHIPFPKALEMIEDIPNIAKGTKTKIKGFLDLVEQLRQFSYEEGRKVSDIIQCILGNTGYREMYQTGKEEDETRLENLEELLNVASQWDNQNFEGKTLSDFLVETTLISDIDSMEDEEKVTLLTIHSSKGLEFPSVFIVGFEENIFPHGRSIHDPAELEEERRLAYVAVTRAEKKLFISYCKARYEYGNPKPVFNRPSRFLQEIPKELLRRV